jgi:beta,beta-carotene 9',10'-dioxygenase
MKTVYNYNPHVTAHARFSALHQKCSNAARVTCNIAYQSLQQVRCCFRASCSTAYAAICWGPIQIKTALYVLARQAQGIFKRIFPSKPKTITVSAALKNELSQVPLTIKGSVPHWLSGTLLRNGPITVTVNGKTNAHEFDGLAMLHAFSFDQGKVRYTNKFLRCDAYDTVFKEGSIDYAGFAHDPCRTLFKRFLSLFSSTQKVHNASVNVGKIANRFVALTERPLPVEFNKETLDTLGVLNYADKLPHNECWESAHPHYDSNKQETINYLVQFGRKSYYVLYSMSDGSSERKVIGKVPVDNPAYMHSFAVTDNYVVLTEFPLKVKPLDLLLKGKAFMQNFCWDEPQGTRFIVVDRHTGTVKKICTTKPFFAFHHANAFEDAGTLHIDMITYKNAEIVTSNAILMRGTQLAHPSQLERFSLSLNDENPITSDVLFSSSSEFPRINETKDGHPYQFVYTTGFGSSYNPTVPETKSIYKINTSTKAVLKWSEHGCSPGEPIFVPDPNDTSEDAGVILTVVIDHINQGSFLLILDPKTMQEIGRADAPHLIPKGLHGQYFQ